MFFVLSKTLSFLIYPLSLAILLFLLTVFFKKNHPKLAKTIFYVALVGLYLFSIAPVADLLLFSLEFPFEKGNIPENVEAIVVLSGMVDLQRSSAERIEMSSSADRIIEGIILAKNYPDTFLILSGGSGSLFDQSKSESEMVEILALRLGIPKERIRLDNRSRNTYENAVESKKILDKEGISRFLLITSASHMRRALGCFRKVGLKPIPYAVDFRNHLGKYNLFLLIPGAGNLQSSTAAIHKKLRRGSPRFISVGRKRRQFFFTSMVEKIVYSPSRKN